MKDIFRGYYKLDEDQFSILWKDALFILDANVLLDLYRYKEPTRNELLRVIEQIKERLWIPYHVGLEFQRKRLAVINDQYELFNKVKSIAEENIKTIENELNKLQINKRHSHIEQKALIDDLNEVVSLFLSKLDKDKKKAISISSDDEIRNKLDKLIKNIGSPPGSQEKLSNIFKEGEERFKNKIPPGYEDSSKKECFTYSGLAYEEKYGDLIV